MTAAPSTGRMSASFGSMVNEIPEGFTGYDGQAGLDPEIAPHGPGNTFGTEEVGAVREELHVRMVFLGPLHVRADEGDLLEDCLPVGAGEPLEVLVGERDDGHFRSLPSCGAAKVSRGGTPHRSCAGGGGP